MTDLAGLKRVYAMPRRVWHGADLDRLTPQGRWRLARSEARYLRRADAYGLTPVLTGEIGRAEGFRFIFDVGA